MTLTKRRVTGAALACVVASACGGSATEEDASEASIAAAAAAAIAAPSAAVASVAATWSILDAGCGAIDAVGLYTAPLAAGACRVLASVGGVASAPATVTVAAAAEARDRFGVRLLYPTAAGGRTWFLPDDADLNVSAEFVPETRDVTIVQRGPATVYRTAGSGTANQVRLNVHSPAGAAWWRNVEITAYYRYVSTSGLDYPHWEFEARGERHSTSPVTKGAVNDGIPPPAGTAVWPWWSAFANGDALIPNALGTAYHGNLYASHGTDAAWALFEKELSHTAGYAGQRGRVTTANPLPPAGQWFGAKFVVRNDRAATRVALELWLDRAADGNWVRIGEYTDQNAVGRDWTATGLDGTDAAPYGILPNELITWAGPWACFRADNVTMEFRKLSIREIEPLP